MLFDLGRINLQLFISKSRKDVSPLSFVCCEYYKKKHSFHTPVDVNLATSRSGSRCFAPNYMRPFKNPGPLYVSVFRVF